MSRYAESLKGRAVPSHGGHLLLLVVIVIVGSFSSGCAHTRVRPVETGAVLEARDDAGNPITLRIDGVEKDPEDKDGEVLLYRVSYRDPADGAWKEYCMEDLEHRARAIPLQGYWNPRGDYIPDDRLITFACTSGVLAKCVRWGYKPWKTVDGVSLRDHHQACTRMARADYCGNGHAHTRDGTLIDVFDGRGIQTPTNNPKLVLEAAWGPNGATYVARPRYGSDLEALVDECPDRLRGRNGLDQPGMSQAAIDAKWPETLMFNESALNPPL